jgi:monolysocardiolipin acyltransferase
VYADTVLKRPRWGGPVLGPLVRYLNSCFIGVLFTLVLRVMNRFRAFHKERLIDQIFHRERGRGMLTVSNHMSVADDPGLFAALIPWWRISARRLRWVLCTEDVFFAVRTFHPPTSSHRIASNRHLICRAFPRCSPPDPQNKYLQMVLGGGNVIPLDRSGSLEQPLFQRFHEKLAEGSWCHIFAEGKVRQSWRFDDDEPHLGAFKFGVGKLIAHCKTSPVVVPFYHRGMDNVIPEKVLPDKKTKRASTPVSIVPRRGNDIRLHVGEPLDFTDKVRRFREAHPGALDSWRSTMESIALYEEITMEIRAAVLKLEKEAWGR